MTFGENAVSLGDGADCVIKGCYLMKLSLNSISNRLYGENFSLRKEKAKVTLIKQSSDNTYTIIVKPWNCSKFYWVWLVSISLL